LLTSELKEYKLALAASHDVLGKSSIVSAARTDALIKASEIHPETMADLTTSAGENEDLYPHRRLGALGRSASAVLPRRFNKVLMSASEVKAERAAGALDEARRELKKQQKEAGGLRQELAVAVASAVAAKAGDESERPVSRRRHAVRWRMEQEAAERLALGIGPGSHEF